MIASAASKRFQSWPASLSLFSIATLGEFTALAGWYRLHTAHPLVAPLILLLGFVVERYVVVLWLHVPRKVITPSGNLRPRWLVVAGVTIAEIVVWSLWIRAAEAQEPWFGAVILVAGIHLVHGYEVALLKHRDLRGAWQDPGVIVLTALESIGGIWALWLTARGRAVSPLIVLFTALLIEHLLQVIALKKDAEAAMPQTVPS